MKNLLILTVTVILLSSCADLNGLQSKKYIHHTHSEVYVDANRKGLHK